MQGGRLAVSYTHLDVYKRQCQDLPARARQARLREDDGRVAQGLPARCPRLCDGRYRHLGQHAGNDPERRLWKTGRRGRADRDQDMGGDVGLRPDGPPLGRRLAAVPSLQLADHQVDDSGSCVA